MNLFIIDLSKNEGIGVSTPKIYSRNELSILDTDIQGNEDQFRKNMNLKDKKKLVTKYSFLRQEQVSKKQRNNRKKPQNG